MEYIYLKNSDLMVSRICIGGDPMGGHAWGKTNDNDLLDAIAEGIEQGINFFDTADIYGIGKAETLLGTALKGKRDKVVIASKFGVRQRADKSSCYYDNSPNWIRQAVEGSLKRLNTDYIDIYQLHWRDGITPIGDVIEELDRLKEKGLIRYFGLSNISKDDFEELLPYKGKFITFQNQYSLAFRNNEKDILLLAKELELTPLTWGSLGQGILTGKYGRDVKFDESDRRSRSTYPNFHGDKLQKNIDIVDQMKLIGCKYKKQPAAVAIRFILDYFQESAVLVGVKNKQQVLSNCKACGWKLTQEDIQCLLDISREENK
jgi:aryl-alcohol dehydrogenase-like predicted oxidoreductase